MPAIESDPGSAPVSGRGAGPHVGAGFKRRPGPDADAGLGSARVRTPISTQSSSGPHVARRRRTTATYDNRPGPRLAAPIPAGFLAGRTLHRCPPAHAAIPTRRHHCGSPTHGRRSIAHPSTRPSSVRVSFPNPQPETRLPTLPADPLATDRPRTGRFTADVGRFRELPDTRPPAAPPRHTGLFALGGPPEPAERRKTVPELSGV